MSYLTSLLRDLPLYLLSLPVLLMAFSVHETAHGYTAYRLGDPTARSLGRLTLNPIKHIDPFGFICMMIFHVGWAKPVPVNARYFKNPKRDMALTGAAGPLSNLALAIIHLVILRIVMLFLTDACYDEAVTFVLSTGQTVYKGSLIFTIYSLIVYLLYLGIVMNISLAIFNLIPVPPFDGSRIFYAVLPQKLYWGVMKYERIIMMVMLVLFFFGFLETPLAWIFNKVTNGLFFVSGMYAGEAFTVPGLPVDFGFSKTYGVLEVMLTYIEQLLTLAF
ncbi:MAG: site-2 protease family protein [Clostridia bacterium]|nr:site-2 protease family protein [Clostridia bacterium]